MRARARSSRSCPGRAFVFGAAVALGAPLAGCGACEPDRSQPARVELSPAPSTPLPVASAHAGTPLPTTAPPRPREKTPCRAIAVDGDVRLDRSAGGAALARQDAIEPETWIWLASDSRLVAKDPRTARETSFRGPGHVRPCVDFAEESWITSGTFESAVGAGETPGAEEWVVTPVGVVRYGAARVTVDVPIRSLHDSVGLGVTEGVAFAWLASDATAQTSDGGPSSGPVDDGWARIAGAQLTLTVASPRPAPESARAAIEACRLVGRSALDLANALVEGDAGAMMAAAQVRARRLARAACAVAAIRVDSLSKSSSKENLVTSLRDADALWRSAPMLR